MVWVQLTKYKVHIFSYYLVTCIQLIVKLII